MNRQPTEADAAMLVEPALGEAAARVARFPTGLANYVYDVVTVSGAGLVVRMSATAGALNGTNRWLSRLRALGVPVPRVLFADLAATVTPFSALVLERLPGVDLGEVLPSLSLAEKRAIAAGVVAAQQRVHTLPLGAGYGYVADAAGPFPHRAWRDVVAASLARSRARIEQGGAFDPDHVTRLEARIGDWDRYLAGVRPIAFLDDTTTKNVLVHEGRLSGIVDIDVVCYGDPLWTVALTKMALLSGDHDLDYLQAWCEYAAVGHDQLAVLDFYTAVFCVDFMSEVGQTFNRETAVGGDPVWVRRLEDIYLRYVG